MGQTSMIAQFPSWISWPKKPRNSFRGVCHRWEYNDGFTGSELTAFVAMIASNRDLIYSKTKAGGNEMCEIIEEMLKERIAEQFAVAQTLKLPKQIIIKVLMITEEQYEKMLLDYNHNDV